MTDKLEQRMHEAFDQEHMPAGLAERTLARIEEERQAGAANGPADGLPHAEEPSLSVVDGKTSRRTARRHRRTPLIAALAACLVLVALGVGGVAWAWQPYAYVAIDVNPSIELGINRFDRVASTRSYNDDGAELLEKADVDGMVYEDAMDALEEHLQDYLATGTVVQMTVICDDEAEAATLETVGTRCLDASGAGQVHCSHASEEEHHAASNAGIGIGKYRVWQQLADAGVDITVDEAANMTMRELLDMAGKNDVSVSGHEQREAGHHGEGAVSTSSGTATQEGAESGHRRAQNGQHGGRHHE